MLAPSQKHEMFVAVVTGQYTQREAARKVEGRPHDGGHDLPYRQAGCVGGVVGAPGPTRQDSRAGGTGGGPRGGRAAACGAGQAGRGVVSARGKIALGLTAGPVPPRVDASVKAGMLDLIDHACEHGWPVRAACAAIGLDHLRAARWASRRSQDRLADLPPGGNPVHGLLDWERAAIVELYTAWGERDRSHRKLAHRGSYLERTPSVRCCALVKPRTARTGFMVSEDVCEMCGTAVERRLSDDRSQLCAACSAVMGRDGTPEASGVPVIA